MATGKLYERARPAKAELTTMFHNRNQELGAPYLSHGGRKLTACHLEGINDGHRGGDIALAA